jgi:hypothetical protein
MKAGSASYTVESFRTEPASSDGRCNLILSGWFHGDSDVQSMRLDVDFEQLVTHEIAEFSLTSQDVADHLGPAASNRRFSFKAEIDKSSHPLRGAVIRLTLGSGDGYDINIKDMFKPHGKDAASVASDVVMRFESLGDNCEFGLMQRAVGKERLGLFRYAGTLSTSALIRGIQNRFEGFGTLDDLQFHVSHDEWIGVSRRYGYVFHTRRYQSVVTEEQIREEESARLPFLARLLLDDIEQGDKIFVRRIGRFEATGPEQGMHELYQALRDVGPVKLLWVTQATPMDYAPRVTRVADGLFRGLIGRLSPYENANDFASSDWIALLSMAGSKIDEAAGEPFQHGADNTGLVELT